MNTPARLLCTLAALGILTAALPAQGPEHRVYDLRSLTTPDILKEGDVALHVPRTTPLAAVNGSSDFEPYVVGYPRSWIPMEDLTQTIDKILSKDHQAEVVGGQLHLSDSAAVHQQVGELLLALETMIRPPLEIELHFLQPDAPLPAILTAEATTALLTKFPPLASHRCKTAGDVPLRLRSARRQEFLRDNDVEVAEKSAIYDPKVDTIFDGLDAGILATSLADNRIQVTFAIQEAELMCPMTLRLLRGELQGALHQPKMNSRLIAGSGILQSGGALVLGRTTKQYGLCVLRVTRRPQSKVNPGRYYVTPLGDCLHPTPEFEGAERPRVRGEGSRPSPGVLNPANIDSLILAWQQQSSPDSEFGWPVLANHIVSRGQDGNPSPLHLRLQAQAQARRSYQVRARTGLIDDTLAKAYLAGTIDAAALLKGIEAFSTAVLPGRFFQCIEGTEQNFISDYDVEIAQKAKATNPMISTLFSGSSLAGTLLPTRTGLSFTGRFLISTADLESIDLKMPGAHDLDLLSSSFVEHEFSHTLIERGAWTVLLVQPAPKKGHVVLALRVDD